MITPLQTYQTYLALKLHFTGNYDALKYNFKVNVSAKSFQTMRGKYFYQKLARKMRNEEHLREYLLASFVYSDAEKVPWIGDIVNEIGDDCYSKFTKVFDSFGYVFQGDIRLLSEVEPDWNNLINNQVSLIFKHFGVANLETMCLINHYTGFVKYNSKRVDDGLVWPMRTKLIEKYTPFVIFKLNKNVNKFKKLILSNYVIK